MSFSPSRIKGKSAEPIPQKNPHVDDYSLLQELLPKAALHLASLLLNDDKEVLIILVLFGCNAVTTAEASMSIVKSPTKPWKGSSSKAGPRQQVCHSCPFSDSLAAFTPLMEEILSKNSPSPNAKYKSGFRCECFSCYSTFWSRWSASPNRDVISDILDVVENTPQGSESIPHGSKGKKKKKVDRKREILEKKVEKGECSHSLGAPASMDLAVSEEGPNAPRWMDTSGSSHTSIKVEDGPIAMEDGPSIAANKTMTGSKKSLFRGIKQKGKSSVSSPNMTLANAGGAQSAVSVVCSGLDESENCTEVVASEIPENLTLVPPSVSFVVPKSVSQVKNNVKPQQHHRLGKRRSNQVLPLDYEDDDISATEREQEAVMMVDNAHLPMSPRVADAGLGGRGFLARVFPDALGRVASRLWDLISLRLHSHAVEYH